VSVIPAVSEILHPYIRKAKGFSHSGTGRNA